ncbi:MAG TPA: chemotaxis protein CheW [Bryobacteraceae bacterium]|nr:chemotaxis protein CheW [Bryobacteraceae bacterium]HPT28046.1 chemotaxis protein CheW [Bryobacteraceae bacterium]
MQAAPVEMVTGEKNRGGKYLVFHLGQEEFGVEVLKIREIMGLQDITSVPQTSSFVKGVINLRGKVIPVIDLRLKFGLDSAEYTQRTCIVVVQVEEQGHPLMMGVIVDGVNEVLTMQECDIEDTPEFGDDLRVDYILGMAKCKGKVKILLDIDKVLSVSEIRNLELMPLSGDQPQ